MGVRFAGGCGEGARGCGCECCVLLRARGSLSELGGSGGEEGWAEGAAAGRKGLQGHPRSLSHFVVSGIYGYECMEVLLLDWEVDGDSKFELMTF